MIDPVYLAGRYLAYHKIKTAVLVAVVAIVVYLPIGLQILVRRSDAELTARAESTPLLLGAKGSPLELVLNSLYFESEMPPAIRFSEIVRADDSQLARVIPMYTRFHTADGPIVGTSLEYFEFRHLQLREGRMMAMLGECVLGAQAAEAAQVPIGGSVMSSPEGVFDIAGAYPLKMRVVGILQPSGTPDDLAVFVDVKTCWVIEGLAHGHEDLSRPEASSGVLRTEGNRVIGNASVVEYNEITAENVGSFHFHGDPGEFPLTSAIVVPPDDRASALFQGRFVNDERAQILEPAITIADLRSTIFTVGRYVILGLVLVGIATLATVALVFVLSLQLRRRELETMRKIGGHRGTVAAIVSLEIAGVLATGVALAGGLAVLTAWATPYITRAVIAWS